MGKLYQIQVILGSDSDRKVVDESGMLDILQELGIKWQLSYISAHRHKDELRNFCCLKARENWAKVFITAAGMMPGLPGDVAGWTNAGIPVIGVVLDSPTIPGKDTIATAISMPKGTPVLFAGIGKPGLANAAIAAAQILAVKDPRIKVHLADYRAGNSPRSVFGIESSDTYKPKDT